MNTQVEAWYKYCLANQLKHEVWTTGADQISNSSSKDLRLDDYESSLYSNDSLTRVNRQIGLETVALLRTFYAQFN